MEGYKKQIFGNTIAFKRKQFYPAGKGHDESERPFEVHQNFQSKDN